ncbi:MAG: hypothetical protein CVU48_05470 [Candidatus Cloacimonetes bacterium HGW-Cloacimonetes-1]|nr:MAG: hypothetical protein CVU48_05470 [Candidatus Cloacimonetes bacterium HGW-Cloacimonetes-1]
MKVVFGDGTGILSGKFSEIVYCYSRRYGYTYVRKRVYPTLSTVNEAIGTKSANIWRLNPSEAFKNDSRSYVAVYDTMRKYCRTPLRAWSCLFTKLMYALEDVNPEVDLRTINRDYIYAHDLPCISIKKAVEARLLPAVKGYETLDHEL